MTAGCCRRFPLLFGFLIWSTLGTKCVATISNHSLVVTTTKEAALATAPPTSSHREIHVIKDEDADESTVTTDSSSAPNTLLRHPQRSRSRLVSSAIADGPRRSSTGGDVETASQWQNDADKTPGHISRGKKKFVDGRRINQTAIASHGAEESRKQQQPSSSLGYKSLESSAVSRSFKGGSSRREHDAYVFESPYSAEESRGGDDVGYDRYSVSGGETDDDGIDYIRNFNVENGGGSGRKDVVDIVKRPQGFALSPPPPPLPHSVSAPLKHHDHHIDQPFEPANSAAAAHYLRTKESPPPGHVASPSQFVAPPSQFVVPPHKRVNYGEVSNTRPTDDVAPRPNAATEPSLVDNVSKNEIWKKPPAKLVPTSNGGGNVIASYPKRTHSSHNNYNSHNSNNSHYNHNTHTSNNSHNSNKVGTEDSSNKSPLPTTSMAWALASMRTTNVTASKSYRQPSSAITSTPSSSSLLSLLAKKTNLLEKEQPLGLNTENVSPTTHGNSVGSGNILVNGVKPFVSWSTILQKKTTEPVKDSTTTTTTTTLAPAPVTTLVVEDAATAITNVEPKLTKISTTLTKSAASVNSDGNKFEGAEEEGKVVAAIAASPTSGNSGAGITSGNVGLSSSSPPRKANASNDVVQNDVGSTFDREDGDYGGGDPHSKSRVEAYSSTSTTAVATSADVAGEKTATSSVVSSTATPATLGHANRESEHRISQLATNSNAVVASLNVHRNDDQQTRSASNATTNATSTSLPFLTTDLNSHFFERNESTAKSIAANDSNDGGAIFETTNRDIEQTMFADAANSSFTNASRSAADVAGGDQPVTTSTTLANTFAASTNASVFSQPPHVAPVDDVFATTGFASSSTATENFFDVFGGKEGDYSWIALSTDTETTTASSWPSRSPNSTTLSSVETVFVTGSFPSATTRPPSTSWPTFTSVATGRSTTTGSASDLISGLTSTPNATSLWTDATTIAPVSPTTSPTITMAPKTTASTSSAMTTPRTSSSTTTTKMSSTTTEPTTTATSTTTVATTTTTGWTTTTSQPTTTSRMTTTTASTSSSKPKIGANNVPGYLKLVFKTTVADICETSTLKENLIQFITQRSLRVQSRDQVVMMIDPQECREPSHSTRSIPVALYVVDEFGGYDRSLVDEMKSLLEDDTVANNTLAIHEVVFRENVPNTSRVIAAIVITSIAAVCFVLLIFLMCAIRSRQKMNYGQRCTPVSVDDYNLDNISEYNSVRRRGLSKLSKRSYSNPSFSDPVSPSKTLTLQGLTKAVENRAALDDEFSRIPTITAKADELPAGVEVKNRYANVIPLPETRVSLDPDDRNCESADNYINANYVKGFEGVDRFYIACQAPLANTIQDFWKMVWNEQTKIIIMLTGLTENGVEKCADYLPPSEVLDCHRLFGDYQITLKKREVKEKYVISSLQLKNMETNLWREVTHLWYTNWPAQGVPNEQSSIIAFLIEARAYTRNSKGPLVVHCSPGTGRTGTVIAIDICIRDYEFSRSVNVPATVSAIRRCRAGAVQTKEQYAFIYKVLVLYAKKLNGGGTALDSM